MKQSLGRIIGVWIAVAAVLANPMQHVFGVATPLRKSGSAVPGDVLLNAAAQRFVSSELNPGETWFDFANAAALYYFLDGDCPTPQIDGISNS